MKYNLAKHTLILLINFLFWGSFNAFAQETISHLVGNPVLRDYFPHYKHFKSSSDTLELPFFDDFSTSNFYPDQNKWTDSYAFINGTYPIDPPSLGVATLDAIDNKGEFYVDAGYGNSFSADTLSSLPINLNYPGDNSIYLSFYTQPKGRGDNPEPGDSLLLEFYTPINSVWTKVWDRVWDDENHQDSVFVQNIIQIKEAKYLNKGFRFRFRNIVSLSINKEPSEVVNVDHWHIDYVYLNIGRSATDLNHKDISFIYPMATHLKHYESMPWKHFLFSPAQELATNVNSYYKNNYNLSRLVDSLYFVFYDNSGNEPNDTLFGGSYDINPKETKQFNPPFTYTFLTNTIDSASFTVKGRIVTDDDFKPNNEVSYLQRFYDYYAYDDGTAEAGYGFTGDGAQNAQLAYKFDCIKQDTLKAIQMYFCRSLNNKSQKYFYLTIWDDNNGEPGNVIYQREAVQPEYEDELNKFHTYFIDDTTLVINRVFYVGWIQTTADMLNLGLDYNRNKNENIFFNLQGFWENTTMEAALMIRPFFGKNLTTLIEPVVFKPNLRVDIYPNPTSDEITINIGNLTGYQQINVEIYNLSGKIVHQSIYQNQSSINLSNLNEGIYLLRLSDKQNLINYTQKIIKLKQ